MKCPDCPTKYVEQTGRAFNVGYKENIHAFINNNINSGSSNYILSIGHTYSTITDTTDVMKQSGTENLQIPWKNITFTKPAEIINI
jgi:hypothetical protein